MSVIKQISKYIFAGIFILGGINHFVMPQFYLRMMPPYLPAHLFLIYLSGFLEIGCGIALLIPKFSKRAAWGIVLLLLAIFPANIQMAMNPELFPEVNPLLLYLRLPLQLVLIGWAFWLTKQDSAN